MPERPPVTIPRGRHAPPLAVRQDRQRERLFAAAAAVFARVGYADASAEAIARQAGMSKATFYEHFDNKEDCLLALFDAAIEEVLAEMRNAGAAHAEAGPPERVRAAIRAFLGALAGFPDQAQTLLVEVVGAGPRAMERRDRALDEVATYIFATTEGLASADDAFAIVGAVVELASRQLRTGRPQDLRELEPVVERLVLGLIAAA
jgi:AcrR family transcriptional regulator